MIIFNAGVPRSGTVLVNAIVRELLRGVAKSVVQTNPHGNEILQLVRKLEESGQHLYLTCIVHTHSWGAEVGQRVRGAPYVRAIANYRDPRDVCVSLMKLHENDFDLTCKAVNQYFSHMEACVRDTEALVLPYELLVASPPASIFQIARHLGLWPGIDRVLEVAEATSIDKHRSVMTEVQSGARSNVQHRQNRKRILVEDKETLINDRHIQSGATGRWRTELSAEQQQMAAERFEPLLLRYGYERMDRLHERSD